ncbi:MAG: hypothetical protein COA79_01850 [Planctomycetota bacterium]|nr:MAG: hypothetical protein COA79_01850 [Planctomycetota bacterium]
MSNQDDVTQLRARKLGKKIKKLNRQLDQQDTYPDLWLEFLEKLDDLNADIYADIPTYVFRLYRLHKFIAKGGQGVTFLVKDGMGRNALMKIGRYSELKDEYVALTSIVSPNIISLYLGERFGDAMVLIEEYVNGVNLGQVLKQAKKNNWVGSRSYQTFITMIIMQILTALDSIHQSKGQCDTVGLLEDRSFVHRDIKPDNIMLGYDGTTKLIDFGLAKKVGHTPQIIRTGFSLPYASPNQIKSKPHKTLDDYFSLTCLSIVLFDGGLNSFFNKSDITKIMNGDTQEYLSKHKDYFLPKLDQLYNIFVNVEKILKKKFVPKNFNNSLNSIKENPLEYGGSSNLKVRIEEMEKHLAQANEFPLAEELYNALSAPFSNIQTDISHLVKGIHMHRFIHHEFLGRQSLLIKPR